MQDWQQLVRKQLLPLQLPAERESQIVEELALHFEAVYEDALGQGLSATEAAARTVQSYDWRLLECELSRAEQPLVTRALQPPLELIERKGGRRMNSLLQDLRFGLRMLLKQPGFTLIAVITLALGIGANTAIFSVVNAVLLRPLPFKDTDRLVLVWNRGPAAAGGDRTPLAVADLQDWRSQSHSYDDIGAFQYTMLNYTGGDTPERVPGASVTANFFGLLGVQPTLGRNFTPDDERQGAPRVAMLSDKFWRKYLAADPQVVGRALNLNGASVTVIGVMPPALDFPSKNVELWTALQLQTPTRRGPFFLTGLARLKSSVSLEQARAEAVNSLKPSFSGELDLHVLPVNEYLVGDVRLALWVLLAAVTLVLLIAAANVANLLLVRSAGRMKELAIRTALGASRGRVLRQLLTESLLLALGGGVLGALWAAWGVGLLTRIAPQNIPRLEQVSIDGRVLFFTLGATLLTGVLFGLAPAWQSARLSLNESLKEGGRGTTESPGKRRWRDTLVVAELALAVLLLVGAGLLLKSFWRLQQVDAGVNQERVLTLQLALPRTRYANAEQVAAFYPRLLEKVQSLPGVSAAAVSNSLPPDSTEFSDDFLIEGRPVIPNQSPPIAYMIIVSPDYFRTFGIPLRRGRYLNATDTAQTTQAVLISESAARQFFPHEDPVGKRLNVSNVEQPDWWQIVGVVGDVKYTGLAGQTQPALYQAVAQATARNVFLSLKTEAADPLSLAAAVRNQIRSLDGELPITQVGTLTGRFANSVAQPRFRTALIALFAAVALLLASLGIYGVISYSVSQRTHEIGVRMALGAQPQHVLRLILKQALLLVSLGVTLGLAGSLAVTRLLADLLFNVSATDKLIYLLLPLLLAGVALLACWIPARRATKVDPLIALRNE